MEVSTTNGMGVLQDRVAVVTGGASGIGRAIALRCAAEGAQVMIADLQEGAAVEAARPAHRHPIVSHRADVSAEAEVERVMRHATEEYGRLDVLIAAAGISGGNTSFAEYSNTEFDRVLAVNLKGVFLSMKYAIVEMLRGGGGAIVAIASVAGLVGLPRTPAYSAAKGGVIQLTKVAAVEYADRNIRVNCICPGLIDTPMVQRVPAAVQQEFLNRQPIRRPGTPAEIAALAVFLASDASAFTTGATFVVDGGYTAQ